MASKSTIKTAEQLLDRFFRDAEGRTNRQIDVYFAVQDMDLTDKAEEALGFLQSRGLLNLFGSDIAFLTDKGVQAVVDEVNIGKLPKEARDFAQASAAPAVDAPAPAPAASSSGTPRPERPQLTHIDLDGGEFTLQLSWSCKIGRADDNEVRINDKRASKHHAEIYYESGTYYLRDLESANGTLLNGDYALEPIPLKHDDEVVIGRTMLLFQTPELVPEPEPLEAIEEAPEEPGTVITTPQPPTERPAPSAEVGSIRVVKGTAVAPPSGQTPAPPVSDADLFAEPPTRAEGPGADLFASSPPAAAPAGPDLFAAEPPTQIPNDDLFGGPTPASEPLEETPAIAPTRAKDDLFADQAPAATGGDDLFSDGPSRGGDDLFSDGPAPTAPPSAAPRAPSTSAGMAPPDPSGGLELEPIASAPELTQPPAPVPAVPLDRGDTVAEPPVDDLWTEDTPPSAGPPAEPAPPPEAATIDTVGDDGDTMMMTRDAFTEAQEQAAAVGAAPSGDEHPHWAPSNDMGSHPGFTDVTGPLPDAAQVEAEALPEASPSLAMPALEPVPPQAEAFYAKLQALEAYFAGQSGPGAEAAREAARHLLQDADVRAALVRLES